MDFAEAFAVAGFVAAEPLSKKAREQQFSYLECEIPAQVQAFYEQCNGGSIEALSARAYPLAQAVTSAAMYDFRAGFRFLPFFVADENASDPAMIGLEPPLLGYVFHLCHDDRSRMLAPSISSFLQSLPAQPEDEFFCLEESMFIYPRTLSEPEQETVQGLIARSMMGLDVEYEPQLLVELALSMLTDEACIGLLRGLDHPDHNARFEITDRLRRIGTPAADEILARADEELKAFVNQAIDVLRKGGFDAGTTNGTDLRVSGAALNVAAFFDRRNDADCWQYLVERVRTLLDQRMEEPSTMGDLPKDAQEIADVLGLDDENAGWLWKRWFTAEAQARVADEGVEAAEYWDTLQGLPPESIRELIAMEMEEAALRARADKERGDQ